MAILFVLLGLLGGWCMIHGMCVLFGSYHSSGSLWGCQYKGKGNGMNIFLIILGFLAFVASLVIGISDPDIFLDALFYWLFALLAGMGISIFTWIRVRNKCYASNHISTAIAGLPFMPDLDRYAEQSHHFELASNGIAFYNEVNFCFAQIIFTNYQLGNIPNDEMFAAFYGFAQKFHGRFTSHAEDRNVGRDTRTDTMITERHYIFRRK